MFTKLHSTSDNLIGKNGSIGAEEIVEAVKCFPCTWPTCFQPPAPHMVQTTRSDP